MFLQKQTIATKTLWWQYSIKKKNFWEVEESKESGEDELHSGRLPLQVMSNISLKLDI